MLLQSQIMDLRATAANNSNLDEPMAMRVAYSVIGSVGILSNGLVILVLFRVSLTKQVINVFIINQSLIDMVTSLMLILCYALPPVRFPVHGMSAAFAEFLCMFWSNKYPCWGSIMASTANLVCLTAERYVAVLSPLRYHRLFRWPRSVGFAVLPWIFGYSYQTYSSFIHTIDGATKKCIVFVSKDVRVALGVTALFLQYFLPLAIMGFAYTCIARSLSSRVHPSLVTDRRRQPTDNSSAQPGGNPRGLNSAAQCRHGLQPNVRVQTRRNVIRTLMLVCLAFFICWTPNQVCYLVTNTGHYINDEGVGYRLTIILAYCNIVVNPFIYAFKYRVFKRGLLKDLPCLRLVHHDSNDTPSTIVVPTR